MIFLLGVKYGAHLNDNNTGNPVIRLDFSEIIRDQISLQEYLQFQIFQHSQNLPNFPKFNNIIFSFVELLTEYSKRGKRPYIFIDEYDAPFWMEPYSQDTIEEFKHFFKVLKANQKFTEQVILIGCTTVRKLNYSRVQITSMIYLERFLHQQSLDLLIVKFVGTTPITLII